MKKIFTKLFLLATFFLASTNLSAQTYYVLDESAEVKIGLYGEKTYSYDGYGGSLSFDARKGGYTTGPLRIDQYINGEWVTGVLSIGNGSLSSSSFKSFSCSLDARATKVRFYNEGSLNKVFKNVKITMATYADAPGATEWTAPTATVGSPDGSDSTTMAWCNTSPFTLSMTGDESQFTYSISNNASAGNYGTATISATYKHNIVGTHNATLTITTALGTHTIKLSGTTTQGTQTIAWAEALTGDSPTLPKGKRISSPANAQTEITYSVADPTIISIDGNTLTALKAGTTTITATAAETNEWLGDTSTITVKVTEKKVQYIHWNDNLTRFKVDDEPFTLTATASILIDAENEITEPAPGRNQYISYQSENLAVVSVDGNTLYINGEGETILTAILQGDEEYEEAVATMPVRVRIASTTLCESYVLNAPNEAKYDAAGGGSYEPTALSGPAHQLTFEAKKQYVLVGGVGNVEIQQYVNGSWNTIAEIDPGKDYQLYGPYTLNRNATNIRFYTGAGSYNRYFKNVLVSQATYLETTTSEITVAQSIIGDVIERTIAVQYSNIPEGVVIDHSSNKIQLSTTELGNACGTYGEKQITLTIIPTEVGTIEDVITIHDEATGKKLEIPVVVHTQRNTQTIVWEQDLANINTTDNITLSAEAETSIYYTSSDSTIAYAEDNHLIINKYGQFTLTAVAVESEKFEQATLSKEITINTVKPTVSAWPTVEQPIAYAQALTTDMLIGGEAEVEGYFDWNTELNQTLVPGTYDLDVRFIPTNANYYAPVDGTVSVTINKSAQSIIWNDSFENITVADSIVLTASAQTQVTYEVSDMESAYITENNVLYFTRGGVVSVTAYASEDDYYLATETVRELTILPAKPNILVKPTATTITYGQTIGESLLEGGEASVLGTFNWLDSLAMPNAGTYWQYVRFTPDDQESFKPVDFQVEVHVDKASQTITWELEVPVIVPKGQSLPLNAVASSGLPITYILDNDLIASIEEGVFTALEIGQVNLTATQDGTYVDEFGDGYTNYFEADPVSYTITIVAKDINTGTELIFNEVKATKIIRDGRLYIIRNGHTYNVNGQVVE